jgi:hypothetical protein
MRALEVARFSVWRQVINTALLTGNLGAATTVGERTIPLFLRDGLRPVFFMGCRIAQLYRQTTSGAGSPAFRKGASSRRRLVSWRIGARPQYKRIAVAK